MKLVTIIITTALILAVVACSKDNEAPVPPTPNIDATIAAVARDAIPTHTPTPQVSLPTPELIIPTEVPFMSALFNTPIPPTRTPVPPTPTLVPIIPSTLLPETGQTYSTPTDFTPNTQNSQFPPCILAGKVTINDQLPPEGTIVFAVTQDSNHLIVGQAITNDKGIYHMSLPKNEGPFDIYVLSADSGFDTTICTAYGDVHAQHINIQ